MAIEYQRIRLFFGNSGPFALTLLANGIQIAVVIKLTLFPGSLEVMDERTY